LQILNFYKENACCKDYIVFFMFIPVL